jgi:hypothetical protein
MFTEHRKLRTVLLFGFEVHTTVTMKNTVLWVVMPCSSEIVRGFGRKMSPLSSTLKMEAIYSSETSVDFLRNTRRHIPEDKTLQNNYYENLRSYTKCFSGMQRVLP